MINCIKKYCKNLTLNLFKFNKNSLYISEKVGKKSQKWYKIGQKWDFLVFLGDFLIHFLSKSDRIFTIIGTFVIFIFII